MSQPRPKFVLFAHNATYDKLHQVATLGLTAAAMIPHPPSKNSKPYKLLNLFYGGSPTTTIDFLLPNQRFEFVQCGNIFVSMRAMVTPLTDQQCRIDFCAAWKRKIGRAHV